MNEITIIPAGTIAATPQEEWLNRGRDIAHRKVALEWDMAEWIAEGVRDGHAKQLELSFAALGKELGIAPPRLKAAYRAAEKFPPALRATDLSVDHHAAIASLRIEEALPLLQRASSEHLEVKDLREAVVQHRYDTAQNFEDDDVGATLKTLIIRAFNRAAEYEDAQRDAAEQIALAVAQGRRIIDEDEVYDDEA